MNSVDDAKRRIGLSIKYIAQGGRGRTDELRKILLSEMLIDVIFPNKGNFAPFSVAFTKVKQKYRTTKLSWKYLVF